jgi:transcription factor IIIB subunit 2
MKRDWMSYGRRPTGLCGAAIWIAAKRYNLDISLETIASTVHVCEETIKKRLDEFRNTMAATLTCTKFESIDIDKDYQALDFPPSCKRLAITANEEVKKTVNVILLSIENSDTPTKPTEPTHITTPKKEEGAALQLSKKEQILVDTPSKDQIMLANSLIEPTINLIEDHLDNDESLSDLDEESTQLYMLNEEEIKLKATMWESLNADWLKKQQDKVSKPTPVKKACKKKKEKVEHKDAYSAMVALTKQKGTALGTIMIQSLIS